MESDADEPRDEGTGLSAFDDLEQVSGLSSLSKLQDEVVVEAPRVPAPPVRPQSVPPPTPSRAPSVPPPPPRGHSVPPPGRPSVPPASLPPLPRGATPRGGSVPPPVPSGATPLPRVPTPAPGAVAAVAAAAAPAEPGPAPARGSPRPGTDQDPTRVMPTDLRFNDPHEAATRSYALEGTDASAYDSAAEPSDDDDGVDTRAEEAELRNGRRTEPDAATNVVPTAAILDDGLLELSATTSSRREPPSVEPEPVTDVSYTTEGHSPAPTPEAEPEPAPVSDPPIRRIGDFEDDAVTSVLRSEHPIPLPTPVRRSVAPASEVAWPREPTRWAPVVWGLLIVVAAIAVGFGIRMLVAKPDPGMATLVTVPIDARVSLDGRPLVGQTSPFSMQGLAPDVEHRIEVTREGYLAQETAFRVREDEVKLLSPIELRPAKVETGFAVDSLPTAATVFIDGERQEQFTPARRVDLRPGRHSIRLERSGYKPWEMNLILAEGQLVELPQVTLMHLDAPPTAAAPEVAGAPAPSAAAVAPAAPRPRRPRAFTGGTGAVSMAPFAAMPGPAPVPRTTAPAGGGIAVLRVNSRPWAQVYVDGRLVGNTPQMNIPLPAGTHQLDLVNPQMGLKKSLAVKLKPGDVQTRVINLVE